MIRVIRWLFRRCKVCKKRFSWVDALTRWPYHYECGPKCIGIVDRNKIAKERQNASR